MRDARGLAAGTRTGRLRIDLDFTRLPSGKFDTNYLVCQLAALAMNILRLMGQPGLISSLRQPLPSTG